MHENGLNTAQLPTQSVRKPRCITIFGALNIVYGGLFILLIPIATFGILYADLTGEVSSAEMVWDLLNIIIAFGFCIWLVILGIGLLKVKKWARSGCVVYAWADIATMLLLTGIEIIFMMPMAGVKMFPQEGAVINISAALLETLICMIYPVLLLIFMQKATVKNAFKD